MPLLKHGAIVSDPWVAVAPDEQPPSDRPAIIGLEHWQARRDALIGRNQPLGLRLAPDQSPDDIAEDLHRFALIALEFPAFTDGRSYSLARLLREKFGFTGELRAVGNILRDQFSFLHRCGFDAFEVTDTEAAAAWTEALSEIGLRYQPTGESGGATVFQLRQTARTAQRKATRLANKHGDTPTVDLLRAMIETEFPGRIVAVSSFGAEAAVLLDLVAQVDRDIPVIFLETGKHFPETLAYRDALTAHLGLTQVRSVAPDVGDLAREDASGDLWRRNPDRCCHLRKVLPLERALDGFDAWITGRKRFHGDVRTDLPLIEASDGKVKINPLATWAPGEIDDWMTARALPRHPLGDLGYLSIGCAPCTEIADSTDTPRGGRWAGTGKTECGIHQARWAR